MTAILCYPKGVILELLGSNLSNFLSGVERRHCHMQKEADLGDGGWFGCIELLSPQLFLSPSPRSLIELTTLLFTLLWLSWASAHMEHHEQV